GETGSPRVEAELTRLMNTGDSKLRQHSIRGLSRIRQLVRASRLAGTLSISFWPEGKAKDGRSKLTVIVTSTGNTRVPDLPATEFLLLEDQDPVAEFQVLEHLAPPVLALGFAIPKTRRPTELGLRAWLDQKRTPDQWGLHRYVPGATAPEKDSPPARIQFSADSGTLGKSMDDPSSANATQGGLASAIKDLMEGIAMTSGARHVICLSGAAPVPSGEEESKAIAARAKLSRITIHGIAVPVAA